MLRGETHCAPINFKPTWLHNSTFILVFPRHFYKTLQTWYSMSQSYICHKIWGVVSKISHLIKIIKVNHHHDLLHHTRSKSSIIHASACSFPSMHWREGSTAAWLTVLIHGETYSVSHLYKDKVFVPSKIWRKTNKQTNWWVLSVFLPTEFDLKLSPCVPSSGHLLDSFARAALWDSGLDYLHGTGHGVGCFLNVHEGPCGISYKTFADEPLEAGMIVSDGMAEGRAGWSCTLARKCY